MRSRKTSKKSVRKAIITIALLIVSGILLTWIYFLPDKRHVSEIYVRLEEVKQSRNFQSGYELMSPSYKETHSIEEFQKDLPAMFSGLLGSPNMNWSKTTAIIAPGRWAGGPLIRFSKIEGKWFCDGIIDWYYD